MTGESIGSDIAGSPSLTPVVRAASFDITNHHHMDPNARFHELVPDPTPAHAARAALPLAALIPQLWERWIVIPRLRHWDEQFATAEERVLAADANRAAGWPVGRHRRKVRDQVTG